MCKQFVPGLSTGREGPGDEAITGLALYAANYGEAVESLKKRFGNR